MDLKIIDGIDFLELVKCATDNLIKDVERINSLNVFPVPDGDTGTNMRMTLEGGITEPSAQNEKNLGVCAKNIAKGMILSGRGNSGVILSQFFKGISNGFKGLEKANAKEFANAFLEATKRSYQVVQNPTEGTILTVMREAGEFVSNNVNDDTTIPELLELYLNQARKTLAKTPELLPVLKKAGVIDSGGAGLCLVIEGMLLKSKGEEISSESILDQKEVFNKNSKLTYGYQLEFILQLQESKVNTSNFDIEKIKDYLNSAGKNLIIRLEDTKIYASITTFNPGQIITECRKYGELLKGQINNLDFDGEYNSIIEDNKKEEKPFKKFATISVANGSGLVEILKEMGIDVVVSGGQTMNTSTQDFIEAFKSLNAENIIVFPNNSNILMAAQMAVDNYSDANVYVVPTKTIAQGFSAASMLNFESNDINTILEELNDVIKNVSTIEVTYSVRDCTINDINIKKGDYICLYNNELIASSKDRVSALKEAFRVIDDFKEKEVMTILCGNDVSIEESDKIKNLAEAFNSSLEVYLVDGKQDIYSYIIGLE